MTLHLYSRCTAIYWPYGVDAEQTYCIVLNLGGQPQHFDLCQVAGTQKVVLSTYLDRVGEVAQSVLALRRDEGIILAPA